MKIKYCNECFTIITCFDDECGPFTCGSCALKRIGLWVGLIITIGWGVLVTIGIVGGYFK